MTPTRRRLRAWACKLAVAAAFVACWTALSAVPASAHAELESSDPPAGAILERAPTRITLTFSDPMAAPFSNVAATAGRGPTRKLAVRTQGSAVTASVPADLRREQTGSSGTAAGVTIWRISYRVVSADGHPVTGAITFRVRSGSPGTPTATPGASDSQPRGSSGDPADTSDSTRGSSPGTVWLLGGLTAILFALAAALILRARSRGAPE